MSMCWFISLGTLNLIDVLTCYLILAFVASVVIRIRNLQAIISVIFTFSHRCAQVAGAGETTPDCIFALADAAPDRIVLDPYGGEYSRFPLCVAPKQGHVQ